jgi:AraC family transcriptional regulator of adaptative response / DNA-3-methyladenine glycosylase II
VPVLEPVDVPLPFRAPLDAAGLLAFLARRVVPGVEEVADGAYRHSLRLAHGPALMELRPSRADAVAARFWLTDERDLGDAVARARALFDLDADPNAVVDALGGDALLGPLVRGAPGRRVPGTVDGDELALRAVLGQQVSLAGASTLAHRLVMNHGEPLPSPLGTVTHLFPTAHAIAASDPDALAMPQARRRALLGLAAALAQGEVALDSGADRIEVRRALLALPGIGPWTASYIAMRALGDRDAFLATDLGVRHALRRLGHDGSAAAAERLAERWRPYRAYAVQHLWASLSAEATRSRAAAP